MNDRGYLPAIQGISEQSNAFWIYFSASEKLETCQRSSRSSPGGQALNARKACFVSHKPNSSLPILPVSASFLPPAKQQMTTLITITIAVTVTIKALIATNFGWLL
jgi:hypothetical protein